MIYGIGCDLCDTARMAKAKASAAPMAPLTFAARVFGPAGEALGLSGKLPFPLSAHKAASAAANFAARKPSSKAAAPPFAGPLRSVR